MKLQIPSSNSDKSRAGIQRNTKLQTTNGYRHALLLERGRSPSAARGRRVQFKSLFENPESCSRRGNEVDHFNDTPSPNPPPHVGGYTFQSGSKKHPMPPCPAKRCGRGTARAPRNRNAAFTRQQRDLRRCCRLKAAFRRQDARFNAWCLNILWSLDGGAWSFPFRHE